jgi:uncharacterized protein YndB with AHSA1/START domain
MHAFETFTAGINTWWPKAHHIGTTPLVDVIIEPREGGRWYSTHEDGSETDTGHVIAWDPPRRLVLAWQITSTWTFDASLVTEVEVRFVEETPTRTRVELEHRHLDRYGEAAAKMVDLFSQEGAWSGMLATFAQKAAQ